MGWYRDRVFPRLMNAACDTKVNRGIRNEVCAPLGGVVLELGFGTGHNLPFLPDGVQRVLAVDPSDRGRELASARLAASTVPVEFVGLDGQQLVLPDASVDAALSTWTLCTIPDATAAVREVARVLRPGGSLHFVEHGRAPDPKIERWQHRLDGLQQRFAAGCHLDRDIPALIEAGGMEITSLRTFYAKGDPKIVGWTYQGVARPVAA